MQARSAGIIAEYNPFHNGHAYQIRTLREKYGIPTITVIMSGNFLQRGVPAWTDKYLRTRMALEQGADFVFELPVCSALSSAEGFAAGSVSLLASSGLAETLCFGCECQPSSIPMLEEIAAFLSKADQDPLSPFQQTIQKEIKKGQSYPAARQQALEKEFSHILAQEPELVSSPNNILAIEYIKKILQDGLPLTPLPLPRTDQGYHSRHTEGVFLSGAAIRHSYQESGSLEACRKGIPPSVLQLLSQSPHYPVTTDDFSSMAYYRLRQCSSPEELMGFEDISPALARRMYRFLPEFHRITQYVDLVKTKNYTYSRIQRCLFHILLDIRQTASCRNAPYLRLLGMRQEKSPLLRQTTKLPVITKVADARKILEAFYPDPEQSAQAWADFQKDILAADLYRQTANQKLGCHISDEFRASPIII